MVMYLYTDEVYLQATLKANKATASGTGLPQVTELCRRQRSCRLILKDVLRALIGMPETVA